MEQSIGTHASWNDTFVRFIKNYKDKSHVLVKKDCGWHFGKTGGPCEKCKDKATSMAAQRRLKWLKEGFR